MSDDFNGGLVGSKITVTYLGNSSGKTNSLYKKSFQMILLFKSKTASRHFFSLSLPLLWITRTKIQTLTGRNQSFNPKDTTELSTEHPTLLRVSLPIPLFTASWEYHSKASD